MTTDLRTHQCTIPDCHRPNEARGWCHLHYERFRTHGNPLHEPDRTTPRPLIVHDEPWMADAACTGVNATLFFPTQGEDAAPARAICRDCPVRQPCLEYALVNKIEHGIFGGTSERERRWLRKARAHKAGA